MPSKKLLSVLFVSALLLPGGVLVVGAFGRLLRHLGDEAGGQFFERVAVGGGLVWVVTLLGLLLATAAQSVANQPAADDRDEDEPS